MNTTYTKTRKITISALIAASYFAVMFATQGFSFGAYQIRIATAIYAFSYLFPFLVVPMGLANALSNGLLGGLGMPDIIGGFIVGIIISGGVALVRKCKLPMFLVVFPIILGSGFIVPIWLSPITGVPYWALVVNISISQIAPSILGYILIRAISTRTDIGQ